MLAVGHRPQVITAPSGHCARAPVGERVRDKEREGERKGVPTSGATTATALQQNNLAASCWTRY